MQAKQMFVCVFHKYITAAYSPADTTATYYLLLQ